MCHSQRTTCGRENRNLSLQQDADLCLAEQSRIRNFRLSPHLIEPSTLTSKQHCKVIPGLCWSSFSLAETLSSSLQPGSSSSPLVCHVQTVSCTQRTAGLMKYVVFSVKIWNMEDGSVSGTITDEKRENIKEKLYL